MPNLIDQSFFIGDINIPNTDTAPVLSLLNSFIDRCEPEILKKVLGYSLYKSFKADSSTQRMTDLKNGKEYTDYYGSTQKWNGLVHDTTISLIAYYTYYEYQANQTPVVAEGGTALVKKQPLSYITPADKMLYAWNKMSDEIQQCLLFLWSYHETYPEFTSLQYVEAKNSFRKNSDFGF